MTNYLQNLVDNYPVLASISYEIVAGCRVLTECIRAEKKILTCGNGGSAADAEHIVGELMKGFHLKRHLARLDREVFAKVYPHEADYLADNLQKAIPAISLVTSVSLATAFMNDVNADFIFAQQVYGIGCAGDVLIAISTSGNSKNVVLATKIAKVKGMKIIALTGQGGGELKKHADVTICVPSAEVAHIQELHLPIYHCMCAMLEKEIFTESSAQDANIVVRENTHQTDLFDKIDLIVFDFDGVFTDNKVATSQDGSETVICDRRDSLGVSMLKGMGVKMFILSTETNQVVTARANKMGIEAKTGCNDKKLFLEKYFQNKSINPANVIYMGNDLNDKGAMEIVGYPVSPRDAHPDIIKISSLVLNKKGGHGAVRELCDTLLKKRR